MTKDQHLTAAEEHGEAAAAWMRNPKMGVDPEFDAIVAGHHANAAMACPQCDCPVLLLDDGPRGVDCPHCHGRGWLRAKDIR